MTKRGEKRTDEPVARYLTQSAAAGFLLHDGSSLEAIPKPRTVSPFVSSPVFSILGEWGVCARSRLSRSASANSDTSARGMEMHGSIFASLDIKSCGEDDALLEDLLPCFSYRLQRCHETLLPRLRKRLPPRAGELLPRRTTSIHVLAKYNLVMAKNTGRDSHSTSENPQMR